MSRATAGTFSDRPRRDRDQLESLMAGALSCSLDRSLYPCSQKGTPRPKAERPFSQLARLLVGVAVHRHVEVGQLLGKAERRATVADVLEI